MIFIHKTLCFTDSQHVRYVRKSHNGRNRNFYRILTKSFQNLNFQNWSNDCAFGKAVTNWDPSNERENEHSRQRRVIVLQPSSPSGRILYFFTAVTRYWKDASWHRSETWVLLEGASKLKTFSRILFPSAIVVRHSKSSTSFNCTLDQKSNLVVHKIANSFHLFFCQTELMTPVRQSSVDSELIYRMDCLEQKFCVHRISVEVDGDFTFLLL